MRLTSSDLELVYDGSNQTVGMRFTGVEVPQGTAITNAWIQFQVDEASTDPKSLTVRGEATDDALTFADSQGNISSRPITTAQVPWAPLA